MKSIQIALLLALFLPAAAEVSADSRPSKSSSSKSSSFKSGFSSQRSAPTSSNRSSGNTSYGGFGNRPSAPPPSAPAPAPAGRGGGFGSFGNSAPRQDNSAMPRKSDSALSQSMNKSNAEASALRTLEARRAAQEAAKAPRPAPSEPQYDNRAASRNNGNDNGAYRNTPSGQYGNSMPMPMPSPVIVQQNSGLMNVITGFLLARATTNNYPRHNNPYPHQGNSNNSSSNSNNPGVSSDNSAMANAAGANAIPAQGGTQSGVQGVPGSSWGMAILRTMAWLAILAVLGWLLHKTWKFLRRGKAPSTANYSFERN